MESRTSRSTRPGTRSRNSRTVPRTRLLLLIFALIVVVITSVIVIRTTRNKIDGVSTDKNNPYYALSGREIKAAVENVSEQPSSKVQTIIDSALSIEGDVHYFWGGKSLVMGKDESWGEMREVTSEGSKSSGKTIPYGLDCSGYVAWCFRQTGLSEAEVKGQLGLGTYHQWENSTEISWSEIRPGDLAFLVQPSKEENHVGICIGFDKEDRPVFAHCASKFDNVVVTNRGDVFNYPRRPNLLK